MVTTSDVMATQLRPFDAGSLKPVVKWVGGKRSILSELSKLFPHQYDTYFEPFVGGASVYLALSPRRAVLNDLNDELIDVYLAIREDYVAVCSELDRLQPLVEDAAEYYRIRSLDPARLTLATRAARFIYLNKVGFNGLYRVNRRGQFNVPFGTRSTVPALYNHHNMASVSSLLQHASLSSTDFEETITLASEGDFVYIDPPYDPLSRTSNFTHYTKAQFSAVDQIRLAAAVRLAVGRGVSVVVSNSATCFVRELYEGFTIHEIQAGRRINSDATKRSAITELAIQAFPS